MSHDKSTRPRSATLETGYFHRPSRHGVDTQGSAQKKALTDTHAPYVPDRSVIDEHALGVPVAIEDAPTTRFRVAEPGTAEHPFVSEETATRERHVADARRRLGAGAGLVLDRKVSK